jgi:hypothetical protein
MDLVKMSRLAGADMDKINFTAAVPMSKPAGFNVMAAVFFLTKSRRFHENVNS